MSDNYPTQLQSVFALLMAQPDMYAGYGYGPGSNFKRLLETVAMTARATGMVSVVPYAPMIGLTRTIGHWVEDGNGPWITDGMQAEMRPGAPYLTWMLDHMPVDARNEYHSANAGCVWAVRYDIVLSHLMHPSQLDFLKIYRNRAPQIMSKLIEHGFGANVTHDLSRRDRDSWYMSLGHNPPRTDVEWMYGRQPSDNPAILRNRYNAAQQQKANELAPTPPKPEPPPPDPSYLWFDDER